ncbi:PREDICTED: DEAD-box ATP-dependent RNA helicase 22 isoform X2 [Nelumbo nucifera]|uniref:DEAD-box ATP-dependent RNA helicase 22 isoform X2 n=1 Tax=Nelumbo nucifera TaxID=4432 RepID=A0A1U8QAH7_NELNU|nr:PREDICTED: DEAD-box ATP-dependent RNA helicase 22 isoform X2 [Nelumbo nucifera]
MALRAATFVGRERRTALLSLPRQLRINPASVAPSFRRIPSSRKQIAVKYRVHAIREVATEPKASATEDDNQSSQNWKIKMLYDGDCPLCMREVNMLRERNKLYGAIKFVDISSDDYSPEENQGLNYETVMGRIHAIMADGTVVTDVEAFRRLYEEIGLGWVYAITKYKPIATLANAIYGIWAKYRLQITGRPALEEILKARKENKAACIPSILSGNDVVMAAETGSGKTHGYLVPLMDKLSVTSDTSAATDGDHGLTQPHKLSLVLCPNVMLCEQVVRMANCIRDNNGQQLLKVAAVCGQQGWPVSHPDIIVSTPAALLNYLYAIDPERRRRSDFLRSVKYVVFDEADMLLCGSFQNQVIRLINMFRFEEKQLSQMKGSLLESQVDPLNFVPEDEELQSNFIHEEDEPLNGVDVEDLKEEIEAEPTRGKYWRRVRKVYERSKQYVFVAATLPVNGKKTAGGVLKRMFPDAKWVNGNYLHCHNPRLDQRWIEVTVDTQVDVLIDAVKRGHKSKVSSSDAGVSLTMVFANTVDAVESVAKILLSVGIKCFCYHSDSSLEERTKNLIDFRERGGILVCTDAAARGLDIPNVSHVIQAEFATSAVDFLHRIGRTGRAGQFGLVTSLYTESNRDLVAAVRQAGNLGLPVEKAFSRKRSFRNKLKKRGPVGVRNASNVEGSVLA